MDWGTLNIAWSLSRIEMSLVTVINLSLTFLGKTIFDRTNLQLQPGDRIGLVGPNGSGKTTLLRLIVGEIPPDKGEIRVSNGTRVGYLPQDVRESFSGPLLQSISDSIPGRVDLENEITKVEERLKDPAEEQERLAARLAEAHQKMADLDRQFPTYMAEKILAGLGFRVGDFKAPIESLSEGWKMRAALASLLYQSPDLLLLDEPTNHLDIPSVRWLEGFLQRYKGALVLVCHDRDFLNRQIGRTISIEPEGVRSYPGDFDFYLRAREEETKILEARARNQEQKIREAKRFIERFRAKASKARQAQSKIKLIKKVELVKSYRQQKTVRFSFPQVPRSGKVVLDIQGVSKAYGKKTLYRDLHLKVLRGERVAVIGPNGSGKTTLLRMVSGEIDPDQGNVILGHGVMPSSYAQHHSEMLDHRKTILEEVYEVVPHETISFVRGVCGAFLFSGDDVEKVIGVLSGGEKARVCLAKILVRPGNLLVMDEPTNHLDLMSSETLIDALGAFNGTLLFVSHNQAFVNRLATKIWDIREEQVVEYPGRLYEYYDHLSRSDEEAFTEKAPDTALDGDLDQRPSPKGRSSRKIQRREEAERRTLIRASLRPIQEELRRLEERIADFERREKEIEALLAKTEIIAERDTYLPLLNEYGETKKTLEELMERWESKQEELRSAKRDLGV